MKEYTVHTIAALLLSTLFDGVFPASLDFDTSGKPPGHPVAEIFTTADSQMLFNVMCQFCCSSEGQLCSSSESCKRCPCCRHIYIHNTLSFLLPLAAEQPNQFTDTPGQHANYILADVPPPQPKRCPCPGAKDLNELCLHWAFVGMCQRAPYMATMCPFSCRVCC
uniref:ShKT domain-containing protein n=1 Tax=Trichuris muris TaxID=70415 RepID=A0A5S6QN09_TRIMR